MKCHKLSKKTAGGMVRILVKVVVRLAKSGVGLEVKENLENVSLGAFVV